MNSGFRSWSDVRVFLAVVRQGSTLAASRDLNMAQPTVARKVDALEAELGLQLFDRDTRGFRPTNAALSLVALAEAIESAARNFGEAASDLTHAAPIRITAVSGNFSPRVMAILSAFSALHPQTEFEFISSYEVVDLMAGDADIALRLTRADPDPDLICRKISTAKFALYGSRDYGETHGLPTSNDTLQGHRFVSFLRGNDPVNHNWLTARVAPEQIVNVFSELELMNAAIISGRGLGIVNVKLAADDDRIVQCGEVIEELTAMHYMLVSPEAHRRPEIRAFTKFFAPRYAAIFK